MESFHWKRFNKILLVKILNKLVQKTNLSETINLKMFGINNH